MDDIISEERFDSLPKDIREPLFKLHHHDDKGIFYYEKDIIPLIESILKGKNYLGDQDKHHENQRRQLKKLSFEDKVKHLDIGLRLQGIEANKEVLLRIVKTYDLVLLKGGYVNLEDIVNIEFNKEGP